MEHVSFEDLVEEALDALPEEFQAQMNNVDVVVEEWPTPDTMRQAGIHHPAQLLGFYHGVPLTQRTSSYFMMLPDKISIYRQPILMRCRTLEEVRQMVKRVVWHEVAHHFGIDDERLHEIGAY
jgi:predicted Zn-dependent protease with MMP-like domain